MRGEARWAKALGDRYGRSAESAGTHPAEQVNSVVVQAMKEVGIDLSLTTPRALTANMVEG